MRTRRTWCQTAPVSVRVTSANFYLPFPPPQKPFVDYRAILAQNKCMNVELCIVSHGTLRNIAHSRQTVVLLVVIWNNGPHSGGRQMRLTRASVLCSASCLKRVDCSWQNDTVRRSYDALLNSYQHIYSTFPRL